MMLRLGVLLVTIALGSAVLYDCPDDWVEFDTAQRCYKFVYDYLSYEQATVICSEFGATLVNVNDAQENTFINNWLQKTDSARNAWFTSGMYSSTEKKARWFGDNVEVEKSLLDNQGFSSTNDVIIYKFAGVEYKLQPASSINSYPYICEISQADAYTVINQQRDFLFGTNFKRQEFAEFGPQFIEFPQNLVMTQGTTQAYIECLAIANPRPTYKWFRGNSFTEEVLPTTDKRYTITNGRLTIQSPNENNDAGYYRCEIENKFGKIISSPVQISFGLLADFSNVQDAPVTSAAFNGAVLECSDIQYKPAVVFNWMRQGEGNKRNYVYTELMPYAFLSANGNLYFTEVTRVDDADYFCQVTLSGLSSNAVGSQQPPSKTSLPISLQIYTSGARADWGPEIHNDFIAVFPQPPMRGKEVRLECFAQGTAANYLNSWSYSWQRDDKQLPTNAKLMDLNRVLVLENAQKEDEGTYTCTVIRGNSASASKSITLKLEAKPYFLTSLRHQHIDEGASLTWRCQAGGQPSPTYQWYKNGKPLTSGNGVLVDRNIVKIDKVDEKKHTGLYQCAATNDHGTSLSEAQIRVLSFKPTFVKSPLLASQDAALRGNVTIACDPEAAPQPVITWTKTSGGQTGISITSGTRMTILSNGYLRITGVQQGDEGFYICQAENKHGKATSSTKLNVRRGTTITRYMKKTEEIRVNNTAFLICDASADPVLDLVYIWNFNNHQIDFANTPNYAKGTVTNGLFIKNVQFTDEGDYECIARTPLNEAKVTGRLTVLGPPGECAGLYGDGTSISTSTMQLNWFNGDTNGSPILYYIIQAEGQVEIGTWRTIMSGIPDSATITTGSTRDIRTILVSGLEPGNGYRFRIQAANAYGIGDISKPSQVYQTKTAPPSRAPPGVSGGGGSVGDLTMVWQQLPDLYHGGPGLGYSVYWRQYSNDPNRQWSKFTYNNVDLKKKSFQYVHEIGEDNFYLEYEVKVQAFNDIDKGPNSTEVIIFSAEGLPVGAPEKVYADGFNSTAMDVFWKRVDNTRIAMKGKVRGYQVNYWPHNGDLVARKQFIRFQGDVDTGRVIGLWADSYFYFNAQVYNTAGLGPLSERVQQETKNPAPFLYPQEVKVFSHGSESVRIKWRGISTSVAEDTVRGYKIYVWQMKDDPRTAQETIVDLKPSEHVLSGLKKDVVYATRIAGFSGGGDGKKSPTVYFTLGGTVYSDPTVTEIIAGASSISTAWAILIILFIAAIFLR